ncbi:unnamed protein product [Rhizophagus irregularis]|uniref:Uncharacterized protein n=1 Tax=Rhizophagus irregularis TaxID=588596 RepID=A0A2I1GU85_9GLOM|nr:hypothetical protein RhiirA4_545791 [Rhizophagus irregularis]CAB4425602.1 unnamed protein product [Rhizophagus irregularis]
MITIDLELLRDPNFPSLEILESRTKTVLEDFNRCRKLNIKLHIKNDKIGEFSRSFNSITDRRALESLRLSMYAEDVGIYIKLLSEENTSVGVILETLSSLLDTAQERHETTKKLKKDYREFFDNFSNEFANIEINLTSDTTNSLDSRQIVIRTGNNADTSKNIPTAIKYVPLFIACGASIYTFYKPPLNLHILVILSVPLFTKGKEFLSRRYQDKGRNKEEVVFDPKINIDRTTNEGTTQTLTPTVDTAPTENIQSSETLIDSILNEIEKETPKINIDKTNVGTTQTPTVDKAPAENVLSSENFTEIVLNGIEESLQEGFAIPDINNEGNGFEFEGRPQTPPIPPIQNMDPEQVPTTPIIPKHVPADPNSLVGRLLTASFFGILVYYSIRKLIRPAQRLWEYFTNNKNKNNKPKSRQISDKQQQTIEKYAKIQEIKEKLPIIIQNVEILDQFWDNQIINIKSHVETLKSVDENEKIRFPQQIAALIKENWNKQYSESKVNYNRMKELVTINSLISPDVSISC